MSLSRTYRKWDSMIGRCYRPSHPAYKYYGGRGITVCNRWRNSYATFLADMGECPEGLWLDRWPNGNGNYEPGNCRWVTPKVSAANRRKRPQVPGSIRQLARTAGIPYQLVIHRIRRGWPVDKAFTIPAQAPGGMLHHTKRQLGLMP